MYTKYKNAIINFNDITCHLINSSKMVGIKRHEVNTVGSMIPRPMGYKFTTKTHFHAKCTIAVIANSQLASYKFAADPYSVTVDMAK